LIRYVNLRNISKVGVTRIA